MRFRRSRFRGRRRYGVRRRRTRTLRVGYRM